MLHGRLDVLINNAGINRRGDLLSLSDQDWNSSFSVNVHALFHLCRAALPHMIAAGGGSIVNTASQWGLVPVPGHIAYNVSKAAVVAFTRNLARDYALHGVRVNAVAPGEIYTPMVEAGGPHRPNQGRPRRARAVRPHRTASRGRRSRCVPGVLGGALHLWRSRRNHRRAGRRMTATSTAGAGPLLRTYRAGHRRLPGHRASRGSRRSS